MLHISRGVGMLFCSGNSLACSKSKLFSHILRCQTFCFPKGKTDEEGWIFKRLERFSATSYVFWFARIAALKQFLYNICMEYCVFFRILPVLFNGQWGSFPDPRLEALFQAHLLQASSLSLMPKAQFVPARSHPHTSPCFKI